MWPVREDATALLVTRFHELRSTGMLSSISLWSAQKWLRTATTKDLLNYVYGHMGEQSKDRHLSQSFDRILSQLEDFMDDERPYADPYFWSGFTFTGIDTASPVNGRASRSN
jgi:CHAT domain-containing protein